MRVDVERPVEVVDLRGSARWAAHSARVVPEMRGAEDGTIWADVGEGVNAYRAAFDAEGRRSGGDVFPDDGRNGWMLRNVQPAPPPRPLDWSRPIEVVFDTGDVAPAVVADLIDSGDQGRRVVRWGPGLLAAFDGSGAQVAVTVRNAPPFDPRRPFRTRDGRPAELIAVAEPPLGETCVLARVASARNAGGLLGQYRADGRPAHGHGTPGDRLGGDDLVNDPPLSSYAPAWDPHRPTRTRSRLAVKMLKPHRDGWAGEVHLDGTGEGFVTRWGQDGRRVGGHEGEGGDALDLVNFDPDADSRAAFAADPLLTVGGQAVLSLKTASVTVPQPDGSVRPEAGLAGDVENGAGRVRVKWTVRGLYIGRDGRGVASPGAHALDLRRPPTDADRAALPGRDDPND